VEELALSDPTADRARDPTYLSRNGALSSFLRTEVSRRMGNTVKRSWSMLRQGGKIISLVDPSVLNVSNGYHGYFPDVSPDAAVLEDFAQQLASGKIKTKTAEVYPRDGLLDAMDASETGGTNGTNGRLLVEFRKYIAQKRLNRCCRIELVVQSSIVEMLTPALRLGFRDIETLATRKIAKQRTKAQ